MRAFLNKKKKWKWIAKYELNTTANVLKQKQIVTNR